MPRTLKRKQGGLTKWFAEDWRDVKTGKKCGRSGKKDKDRPYPACRPKAVASRISKAAKRRKSYCARSAGQMKKFPKAAKNPNSRLRQARRRWKC